MNSELRSRTYQLNETLNILYHNRQIGIDASVLSNIQQEIDSVIDSIIELPSPNQTNYTMREKLDYQLIMHCICSLMEFYRLQLTNQYSTTSKKQNAYNQLNELLDIADSYWKFMEKKTWDYYLDHTNSAIVRYETESETGCLAPEGTLLYSANNTIVPDAKELDLPTSAPPASERPQTLIYFSAECQELKTLYSRYANKRVTNNKPTINDIGKQIKLLLNMARELFTQHSISSNTTSVNIYNELNELAGTIPNPDILDSHSMRQFEDYEHKINRNSIIKLCDLANDLTPSSALSTKRRRSESNLSELTSSSGFFSHQKFRNDETPNMRTSSSLNGIFKIG